MVSVSTSFMRYAFPAGARASIAVGSGRASDDKSQMLLSPAESASARAKARLKEIRDRLEQMERMGFPAEVVSRLAAALGAEAARSAGQVGTDSSDATGATASSAGTAASVAPSEAEAEPTRDADALPAAYRDVIENRDPGALSDDAAIRREFETLAARIRTLQQRAEREASALRKSSGRS